MDYNGLTSILQDDAYAQELAAKQAIRERVARMTPEEQAASLKPPEVTVDGLKVRVAAPRAPLPPKEPKEPQKLEIYQASSLYGKHIDRVRMIVSNMIPAGLTVLAGAPKRGKSWLALALALAVSSGGRFLDHGCARGEVLYLDLESSPARMQERLSRIWPGAAPEGFSVAHRSERIGEGLEEQIAAWAHSVKDPALVIIDTLGRVKSPGKRGENAYESDTRIYGGLQSLAMDLNISIVLVHHLRKGDADDVLEKISGSMGLVGAADATLTINGKRHEPVSKLSVVGRDLDGGDYDLMVRFDEGFWRLESDNAEDYTERREYIQSLFMQGLIGFMQDKFEWTGSAPDLVEEVTAWAQEPVDVTPGKVKQTLEKYQRILKDDARILYNTKRTSKARYLNLKNLNRMPKRIQTPDMPEEDFKEVRDLPDEEIPF